MQWKMMSPAPEAAGMDALGTLTLFSASSLGLSLVLPLVSWVTWASHLVSAFIPQL